MKKIDRRTFLRTATFAGVGVAAAGLPLWKPEAAELNVMLVTMNPERDAKKLLGRFDALGANPVVETHPVTPAAQDLSVIRNGQLLDPSRGNGLPSEIREFAREMRSRSVDGGYCVTISTGEKSTKNTATFTVDGKVVEQVDLTKDFENIVIPGAQGDTEFRLHDGKLRATKSSCKHDICLKMGPVESGRIVCAPNKLVAKVSAQSRQVDGVTG
ncbi:MAG: NusG domain II-containing protein [Candidatus Marinimicrobia bacterium]|nr:NusG domain II-containing protein [Candidatus Neomarinimicrobiota bacterium]MCF7827347.1 NusG domain II-containing protein [Candidatus Neomarinimicrobiota bacterium]MCF7881420.1 NusG domain II-containing protein [Candidatus Neomarinimicrobiota bacterium]